MQRLRVYRAEIEKQSEDILPAIFIEEKSLPWQTVIEVLEKLRFEADLETVSGRNRKGEPCRIKRKKTGIAESFMRFILLGMFVLIPPGRQRTYRELELGKTFKYGTFEGKRFIPASEMAEPEKAQWYIHLLPADYKTGKTYGEWTAPFPNVKFSDGKTFYEYIDRWLYRGYQDKDGTWHGWREALCPKNHNYMFFKPQTGEQLDGNSLTSKIKFIFYGFTGTPTTPHALRHIYRTYIEDPATKATDAERRSLAFWMQHGEKTANKIYSHQSCQNKLKLGAELSQRLTQGILDQLK